MFHQLLDRAAAITNVMNEAHHYNTNHKYANRMTAKVKQLLDEMTEIAQVEPATVKRYSEATTWTKLEAALFELATTEDEQEYYLALAAGYANGL